MIESTPGRSDGREARGSATRLQRRQLLQFAARVIGVPVVLGLAGCASPSSVASPTVTPGARPSAFAVSAAPSAAPAVGQPGAVNVGVVGSIAEAGIYAGIARGYFQQQGVAVELTRFDSIARAIPSLSTNQVDVGAGAVSAALFNAVDRGVDIRVVGPQTQAEGTNSSLWFVVRRDLMDAGTVKGYEDFKGLSIAVPSTGGTNEYLLDQALKTAGLSNSDVNVVALGFAEAVTALQNKRVDVAELTEPQATVAVDGGFGVKWRTASSWTPIFQLTYLIYASDLRTARADLGRRWMAGYLQGARWYAQALAGQADRAELYRILAQNTAVTDPALMARMSYPTLPPNGEIRAEDMTAQEQWAAERGYITTQPPLDSLVDRQFVQAAIGQIGKV